MRTGDLAEPVWKRSVFRQLNMEITGVRGHYGADCVPLAKNAGQKPEGRETAEAISGMELSRVRYTSVGPVPGSEYHPEIQIMEAVNRLAAGGAEAQSILIQAVLPEAYEEADLQRDMKQLAAAARSYDLSITDVQIQVSHGVIMPQYVLTAVGAERINQKAAACVPMKKSEEQPEHSENVQTELPQWQQLLRPGQELVMTKWIALAGTAYLAEQYEEALHQRYPFSLIDRAKEFDKLISADREARAITHFGACAVHHLSQGGIFNALWEMADRAGVGLEVDLKKIPVKQETIEICEYFDINPYYLYSAGALLVGTDRAEMLISELGSLGVPAVVIGRVTDSHDRVIRNGEDCRFLDRPKQDEWYRRLRHA